MVVDLPEGPPFPNVSDLPTPNHSEMYTQLPTLRPFLKFANEDTSMLVFLPKVKEIMHDVMTYGETYDCKGLAGHQQVAVMLRSLNSFMVHYINIYIFLYNIPSSYAHCMLVQTYVNTFSPICWFCRFADFAFTFSLQGEIIDS